MENPFGEEPVWPPIQNGELVSVALTLPSMEYETVAVAGTPLDETKIDSATVAGLIRPLSVKLPAVGVIVAGGGVDVAGGGVEGEVVGVEVGVVGLDGACC